MGVNQTIGSDVSPAVSAALAADHHWYHSVELAPGCVTPGRVDLRKVASKVLPDDLSGKRALDVGTFDGFWAFEMEARGAEVVATDIDSYPAADLAPSTRGLVEASAQERDLDLGRGFRLASQALGSKADHRVCNIYDLSPDRIGGGVDLAFVGTLLLHLRDPVRGLEQVRTTLVAGGQLVSLEPVSLLYTALGPRRPVARFEATSTYFTWWLPNRAAHRRWMYAAGFDSVRSRGLHRPPQQKPMKNWMSAVVAVNPGGA